MGQQPDYKEWLDSEDFRKYVAAAIEMLSASEEILDGDRLKAEQKRSEIRLRSVDGSLFDANLSGFQEGMQAGLKLGYEMSLNILRSQKDWLIRISPFEESEIVKPSKEDS